MRGHFVADRSEDKLPIGYAIIVFQVSVHLASVLCHVSTISNDELCLNSAPPPGMKTGVSRLGGVSRRGGGTDGSKRQNNYADLRAGKLASSHGLRRPTGGTTS